MLTDPKLVLAFLVMAMAMALAACASPTPTPAPTPTPVPVQQLYQGIADAAENRPAQLETWLDKETTFFFQGKVTHTEIGKIQFHLDRASGNWLDKVSGERDTYVSCETINETDPNTIRIGETVAVRGQLKDAFKQDAWFGGVGGLRNNQVVEFDRCVIVR